MSVKQFKESLISFNQSWGFLCKIIWNILFLPVFALIVYSSTAYLNGHYVSRSDFEAYKQMVVDENKNDFEQVNKKLDVLLLNDAKGGEKLADFEHRISRLENQADQK